MYLYKMDIWIFSIDKNDETQERIYDRFGLV